jgi:hypothetical protein
VLTDCSTVGRLAYFEGSLENGAPVIGIAPARRRNADPVYQTNADRSKIFMVVRDDDMTCRTLVWTRERGCISDVPLLYSIEDGDGEHLCLWTGDSAHAQSRPCPQAFIDPEHALLSRLAEREELEQMLCSI